MGLSKQEAAGCGDQVLKKEVLRLCGEDLRKIIKHVRLEAGFFFLFPVIGGTSAYLSKALKRNEVWLNRNIRWYLSFGKL